MAWFRRRRRGRFVDVGTYVRPPETPLPEFEDLVDEAMLIARQAVRLGVTNSLITSVLRDGRAYSSADLLALARDEVRRVADETELDVSRLDEVQDGRGEDSERVGRRILVASALADQLHALMDDDEQLRGIVDVAREGALDDILAAYAQSFRRPPVTDPDELDRRRALVALDLDALRPGY